MEDEDKNSKSLVLITRVGSTPTTGIKRKPSSLSGGLSFYLRRVSGSNPHVLLAQGILSFGEGFPFGVIWCPTLKRKSNSTSNEFLINLRFFDAFSLYSVFSIWIAQMEIGGMFRRDAGQNAPLLRHKTKGKSRIMNQNQAKEYYKKLFVNYPDVLSVEEATTLLGFKSQTAIIRRIHQHRIRCLKVGRSFMIPKEYLIDYLLDS